MPFVSQSHLDWLQGRITDLEAKLANERADNRRREDFIFNMALRRAQTFPVPTKEEAAKESVPSPPESHVSPEDVGKARAIRDEGYRLRSEGQEITEADIEQAMKRETGLGLADVRREELDLESESIS